ncbi:tonB-system energizer ExbB [Ketogulonicigenium vulgare]|uniref:Biopolymer transport protein ExbB n=1 Tax=Ketogulonicigenium vulgare (strain WSH-001) TaxID=759362 RepID=F9Y3G3_KETVW|nr:tonB-system energizer ExbB [Ketogulonicigenium vulgare]ADO43296.1 ExbB family protein [Ketogulonicigenium vulgare Y25]AEM41583.1 ABC transporter, ATPase subunit [Ketogulonicigenium vulgare WSH-001]ALJ81702.1 biopolymer transport protein ExbB [Ketogulonicigenium vulgare]ANW34369.1 tonB-system energizer ExbB [Ketogulonicigenium vulgare]AOZ55333.1 ExbB family protein [Ketogulonicigenium vulgare]
MLQSLAQTTRHFALLIAVMMVAPAAAQETAPARIEPAQIEPAQIEPALDATRAPEPAASIAHDLSPVGMFMAADWVVKGVMIGLALATVTVLVLWLGKTLELWGARRRARNGLKLLAASTRLEDAIIAFQGERGAIALMVRAAEDEARLSLGALDYAGSDGMKDRIASRLQRLSAGAGRRLQRGTGILATVGAVAPFVGLFGTVWGIMNSFVSIAETQTTNLAVVAPGIAEALLATAIGLVAAIPAVVIYNGFARAVTGYRQILTDAGATIERLVSRDLDWRKVPAAPEAE